VGRTDKSLVSTAYFNVVEKLMIRNVYKQEKEKTCFAD